MSTVTQPIDIINNSHMSTVTQPIDIINNLHMVTVTQPINHNTFHTIDGHLANRHNHNEYSRRSLSQSTYSSFFTVDGHLANLLNHIEHSRGSLSQSICSSHITSTLTHKYNIICIQLPTQVHNTYTLSTINLIPSHFISQLNIHNSSICISFKCQYMF